MLTPEEAKKIRSQKEPLTAEQSSRIVNQTEQMYFPQADAIKKAVGSIIEMLEPEQLKKVQDAMPKDIGAEGSPERNIRFLQEVQNLGGLGFPAAVAIDNAIDSLITKVEPEKLIGVMKPSKRDSAMREILAGASDKRILDLIPKSYNKQYDAAVRLEDVDDLLYWLPENVQREFHKRVPVYGGKWKLKENPVQTEEDKQVMAKIMSMSDADLMKAVDSGDFIKMLNSFSKEGHIETDRWKDLYKPTPEVEIREQYQYHQVLLKDEPKKENLSQFYKMLDAVRFLPQAVQAKILQNEKTTNHLLSQTGLAFMDMTYGSYRVDNAAQFLPKNEMFLKKYINVTHKLDPKNNRELTNYYNPFNIERMKPVIENAGLDMSKTYPTMEAGGKKNPLLGDDPNRM